MGKNVVRDFSKSPGKFHAGRAAADNNKIKRYLAFAAGRLAFCQLERQQNAAADFNGIFDGFQAGSQSLPFVVSEIGVASAGGNDKVVVGNRCIGQLYNVPVEIKINDVAKKNLHVLVSAQDPSDRSGNLARRKSGRRNLI